MRDKVSTAFGQSSAVTPIQQLQAATAIANNGKMMKPYVIDHVVDSDKNKTIYQNKPEQVGQPISAKTAKEVRELLGKVVTSEKERGSRTRSKDLMSPEKPVRRKLPEKTADI